MAPQRLGLHIREDPAIGVTEDAWEGCRIPSHLFGSPAKSQGKRARVGSHGKELQCLDSAGLTLDPMGSQSFAGTVEGEGPEVGTP